ncbi:sensor domain-containing protein [Streptomyces blattellae]|uniref:sensor domain-containing protein n=1 Tax=Streptomyces blattellae TaxID=2569855 RepID=UPI0018ACF677|nr:sensor domain-containing protein [Streptomyces blattellae]
MDTTRIPASSRRIHVAVGLVLPLALIAACGSGENGAVESPASVPRTESASSALSAAQLDKLSLTAGDVKGFTVRELDETEAFTQHDVRTDEADCAPVSQAMYDVALGDPAATAQRRMDSELDDRAIDAAETSEELDAAFTVIHTTVTLASYDTPSQARAALDSLRGSIATCEGGFSSIGTGERVEADTAPDAGDEAVAFAVESSDDGDLSGSTRAVVFREGGLVVQVSAVNDDAKSTDDWDFPTVLVETQDAKLD